MSVWSRIKEHKVLQWTLGYAAAAYTLLHGVEMVGNAFTWPHAVVRLVTLLLILGVPIATTLAWYHGYKGHQRVGGQEIAILAVLLVIAGSVLWLFGRPGDDHADARSEIGGAAAHERAAPEAKSLAVLPFDNRSGDKSQEFYADGLTDELTTALARISGLKVIASSSTARYKGSDKRPSDIAHDLGVASLVTGSVLRADGRIRYTTALISADSEQNVWAESYERDERDVLTLQSEVAGAIAKAIEVRLSPAESERLATARTVDPRAFEEYLLGRALLSERTEQSLRSARMHFENSARIAPEFALAHAGVADSYILLGVHGYEPPRTVMPQAKAAAETAIALDPTAGEPHASLGDILFHYDWDWAASARENAEAIRLAPAFATAYQWSAEPQILNGDLEGALDRLRQARAIDPLSMIIRTTLAHTLGLLSHHEEAVTELRAAIELDPAFPRSRRELALQLLARGRTDEALAEARKLAEIAPDNLPSLAVLGLCLGRAGHTSEARALLKKLDGEKGKPFVSSVELARIAAGLQDLELTIRYLQKAVEAREGFLPFIGSDDEFAFLREDSRYQAIARTVGIGAERGAPVPGIG